MATIAKSSITLVSISDAYSVLLQPSNIVINASKGLNQLNLDNAYTVISLYCGDRQVPIAGCNITNSSLWSDNDRPEDCSLTEADGSLILKILSIDKDAADGWREIEIFTGGGGRFTARFTYTIIRSSSSSMLDWVLDWDSQEKLEVNGVQTITPKIFAGKCSSVNNCLNGVYIGTFDKDHAGMVGYLQDVDVFRIDDQCAMIAGWCFNEDGFYTEDRRVTIDVTGSISRGSAWQLNPDGNAKFANGNVLFNADGSAKYNGEINTTSGSISDWNIGAGGIWKNGFIINSQSRFIGMSNEGFNEEPSYGNFILSASSNGGLCIGGPEGFGLFCYNTKGKRIFRLGRINKISSWYFDDEAMWVGEDAYINGVSTTAKDNQNGHFTTVPDSITIGSKGLRSNGWYFDADGSGALAKKNLNWNANGDLSAKGRLIANAMELSICNVSDGAIDASSGSLAIDYSTTLTNVILLPTITKGCARTLIVAIPNVSKLYIASTEPYVDFVFPGMTDEMPEMGSFNSEGYFVIDGMKGEWFQLIGVNMPSGMGWGGVKNIWKSNVAEKFWNGRSMQSPPSNWSGFPGGIKWFIVPMTPKFHWRVMGAQGLTLN